jgi:predicted nucleotidyltransferase
MTCRETLKAHRKLSVRKKNSHELIRKVRERFHKSDEFSLNNMTVFCAGSLARNEVGKNSDLDVFLIKNNNRKIKNITRLQEIKLFVELMNINNDLNFPEFSNDGEYLRIHSINEMTEKTGSPKDDYENLFTTRMLLLLESKCICNDKVYNQFMEHIVDNYLRDSKGKSSFKPLFILNDILRYWRTLCLNYEDKRSDPNRPWRKKNVSLKFSRMLTVFSTILPLVAEPIRTKREILELTKHAPLERMAIGLDALNNRKLNRRFIEFINTYEEFLSWKEFENPELYFKNAENRKRIERKTIRFSSFIYDALTDNNIDPELKRFLII